VKTGWSKSSKQGYGSKRAVLPIDDDHEDDDDDDVE
jgi:hypothetical protein